MGLDLQLAVQQEAAIGGEAGPARAQRAALPVDYALLVHKKVTFNRELINKDYCHIENCKEQNIKKIFCIKLIFYLIIMLFIFFNYVI